MDKSKRCGPPRESAKRVALPRLRADDWTRWLAIASDAGSWPATHSLWMRESQERADRLARAGLEIVWIDLDPTAFSEWCRAHGHENDAESRNRFAAEQIGNMPTSEMKPARKPQTERPEETDSDD